MSLLVTVSLVASYQLHVAQLAPLHVTCNEEPSPEEMARPVQESPLAGLMHLAQREAAADVVNSAILAATAAKMADADRSAEGPSKAPTQPPAESKPQVLSALTASLQRSGPDCTVLLWLCLIPKQSV